MSPSDASISAVREPRAESAHARGRPGAPAPAPSAVLFAREALAQIPKLLTLLDRNRHSPSFGCFDRNYWHYKIIDFPSGMAQEFCWPLALAYEAELPGNLFFQQPAIKDWALASIFFAAKTAHRDGSCDDYFPFEKAGGAAAFSLLACVETARMFNYRDGDLLAFFEKRANWLAHHWESGRLSNHQALIVLGLDVTSEFLGTERWEAQREKRLARLLAWQHEEGWFSEYDGFDPGYHTLTLSCLARIQQRRPDPRIEEALRRGLDIALECVHPDGTFGGEYGSRNTLNFFPHGFELIGSWDTRALSVNDAFLGAIQKGLGPCYADDHIIGHHAWNYLLAWRDFVRDRPRPGPPARREGRAHFPGAGLLFDRRPGVELIVSLAKGGVFKLFRDGNLVASDTHVSLLVRQGRRLRNAVGHLADQYPTELSDDAIVVRGKLGWAKQKQMTPLNLLVLRVLMLTVGRFNPDLVRKLLQRVLITGKQKTAFQFERRLEFVDDQWVIRDTLEGGRWSDVVSAGIAGDQTSIYVVMSRTFQAGQLQPWFDLTNQVRGLRNRKPYVLERTL